MSTKRKILACIHYPGIKKSCEPVKVLSDTNIIIHREASKITNQGIGVLFYWLDKLHYTKCVHPLTSAELQRNINGNGSKQCS